MRHAGFWLLTCISYSLRYGAAVPEQLREERVLCLTDPEEDQESMRAWAHPRSEEETGNAGVKLCGVKLTSPFYVVEDSSHRTVPPMVEVGLPPSTSCR